jgi:hypothetical protein
MVWILSVPQRFFKGLVASCSTIGKWRDYKGWEPSGRKSDHWDHALEGDIGNLDPPCLYLHFPVTMRGASLVHHMLVTMMFYLPQAKSNGVK